MAVDWIAEARAAPDPTTAERRARLAGRQAAAAGIGEDSCPFDGRAEAALKAAWLRGHRGEAAVPLAARPWTRERAARRRCLGRRRGATAAHYSSRED